MTVTLFVFHVSVGVGLPLAAALNWISGPTKASALVGGTEVNVGATGEVVTVRTALELVAVAIPLLRITLYLPASVACTFVTVKLAWIAPSILVPLICH